MGFKMKYNIKKDYIEVNTKRRSGEIIEKVGFIVAHDTGNPNSTAKENVAYYKNTANNESSSAHIFVDDKDIIMCIPALEKPEKAWHVWYQRPTDNKIYGDDANDIAIGVEYCYGSNINAEEAYKRYVWTIAYLCYYHDLNPVTDVIGHMVLDPERKNDPENGLQQSGKSYNQLLLDIIKEYNECKENVKIKLEDGRIITAYETKDDYYIPLSKVNDLVKPLNIIKTTKNKITSKGLKFMRVLKLGCKGEDVKELQKALIKLGYDLGKWGADGDYGKATKKAVIQFQKDNKLVADGIAGKNTFRKINELLSKNKNENTIQAQKEYLQVTADLLNVRDNKWGNIIGQVEKGDILEKIGTHKDGDWYKIKFKNLEGYVSGRYVIPYLKGFKKIRKYDSDIYIYETSKDEFVDVTLGQYGKLETLSDIVKNSGKEVVCATNGGFFDTKGSTEHLGTFVDEGLYYKPPSDNFIDFIYYKDGTTEIKKIKDLKEVAQLQATTHWAIGTSWSLVKEGKIDLTNTNKILHSRFRNPRTLLGQKKDGTFVLVVVDGRRKGSKGMTAKQCARLMLELGCYNAVNLDGGGSSEMIVNNIVVNQPSDGHERKIGSAVLVYKK